MKNIRNIVMVIIGTLIGAGFASGREIYVFFFKFGKTGILGIVVSAIITGLIIYFTLKIAKKNELDNYDEFIETVNKKNKIIKPVVIVFLLISFFIMIAGFSAYIKQAYKIEIYISSTVFALIVYFILIKNVQGMLKINNFLVPIIIILIIFLGIKNLPYIFSKPNIVSISENGYWLIYSILYASYNSIILVPVIVTLKKYIKNKNEIKYISIISVGIIVTLSLCIFGLLLKAKFNIENVEMPILEVLNGTKLKNVYGIIIIMSIFTSAISVGYSFLENISTEKTYKRNLIIICVLGILVSNIGFSNLVSILYPIFGVLGLVQIYYICKNALEKKANKCYKLSNKKCGRIK
ncbi:MAG: hypothetical protein J6M60_06285 [Clostridia bacterium]|nr:hypothetical protein [Clostridia bacterium]